MTSPTAIAAYLALFALVGFVFLFSNLLLGRFLRPHAPNAEKLEVYECGEPPIGSSFVQFDLRFYVVALLFIIFDVEIAFFFPWATVFGKATQLMDPNLVTVRAVAAKPGGGAKPGLELTPAAAGLYRELGVDQPTVPKLPSNAQPAESSAADATAALVRQGQQAVADNASRLALLSIFDIGVFFAVLMVGFAYVWKRGDLDWVRAVSRDRAAPVERSESAPDLEQEPLISA
jgi:NADH-quinone oxidoreductase subunit A